MFSSVKNTFSSLFQSWVQSSCRLMTLHWVHLWAGLDGDVHLVQCFQFSPLANRWECFCFLCQFGSRLLAQYWQYDALRGVSWLGSETEYAFVEMDQTFIYPFNSVLTTLLWARYSVVSHWSREGSQSVVYNSVTHSPLGGNPVPLRGSPWVRHEAGERGAGLGVFAVVSRGKQV